MRETAGGWQSGQAARQWGRSRGARPRSGRSGRGQRRDPSTDAAEADGWADGWTRGRAPRSSREGARTCSHTSASLLSPCPRPTPRAAVRGRSGRISSRSAPAGLLQLVGRLLASDAPLEDPHGSAPLALRGTDHGCMANPQPSRTGTGTDLETDLDCRCCRC